MAVRPVRLLAGLLAVLGFCLTSVAGIRLGHRPTRHHISLDSQTSLQMHWTVDYRSVGNWIYSYQVTSLITVRREIGHWIEI